MRGTFPGVILEEGAAVAGFCTHCLLSCPLTPELGPEGNFAFAAEPHLNQGFTSSYESEVLVFMTSLCPMQNNLHSLRTSATPYTFTWSFPSSPYLRVTSQGPRSHPFKMQLPREVLFCGRVGAKLWWTRVSRHSVPFL